MRVTTISLISALALAAGCSKPPQTAPASSAAPVTAHPDNSGGLGAVFRPHRKSGLWDMSIDSSGGPGVRMNAQMCVDSATDKDFAWHSPHSPGHDCQKTEMRPAMGGGLTFDSVCSAWRAPRGPPRIATKNTPRPSRTQLRTMTMTMRARTYRLAAPDGRSKRRHGPSWRFGEGFSLGAAKVRRYPGSRARSSLQGP